MSKQEFLRQLEDQLRGNVSEREQRDSIQYYTEYIDREISDGRTEEEAIAFLGSPTGIAKAIIEARGGDREDDAETWTGYREDRYGYDAYGNDTYGYDDRDEKEPVMKVFQLEGWTGRLLLAAIVILLIALLVLLLKAAVFLLPIIIPAALILCLIRMIKRRR